MSQNPIILFVCEHGAAKSVIAATYFNKLASERNTAIRAIARGTHPEPELSTNTIAGLKRDGLTPIASAPEPLTLQEVMSAEQIIAFCELPEEYRNKTTTEQWDDIPPVSEDYNKSRDAILEKLNHLLR